MERREEVMPASRLPTARTSATGGPGRDEAAVSALTARAAPRLASLRLLDRGTRGRMSAVIQRLGGNAALQRAVGAAPGADPSGLAAAIEAALGEPGRPLDASTRGEMEAGLGGDFGAVRVHTGPQAAATAEALGARAYTVGTDIVLAGDAGGGERADGRRLLAHELAHVVQQSQGPVAGTPVEGGLTVSHPDDPYERAAEAAADAVVSGGAGSG